tara:strand:- start:980 stop:1522 length:543 start_codon:yes stop_codon:yes gene_type:complete
MLGDKRMKHIKENCNTCGVELTDTNWNSSWQKTNRTQCQDCNNPNRKKHNPDRMYVNGKYISKSNPLHRPGRYINFNNENFSSIKKVEETEEGEVYVLTNNAWPGWVKIGMTIDIDKRLVNYQTGSPLRDYTLHYTASFDVKRKAEAEAHRIAGTIAKEQKNEWFKIDTKSAIDIISSLN